MEKRKITMKMVQTNMGKIPLEDYLEIVAMQYGFDSYEELCSEGLRSNCEYEEVEKEIPEWY